MGIPCTPLGVGGREDSVDKNEGTNDLSTQAGALVVARLELVGTTTVGVVVSLLESLDQPTAADGTQALSYHVHDGSDE